MHYRILALVFALGLAATSSKAQSTESFQERRPNDQTWFIKVTPYYWASNISGARTLGQPPKPNVAGRYVVDVGDHETHSDFAGTVVAGRGSWAVSSFLMSGFLARSGTFSLIDDSPRSVSGAYEFGWREFDLKTNFRLGPVLAPYLQVFGGLRWMNWRQTLTGPETLQLGRWDEWWLDPVLGASLIIGMGSGFDATAYVDAAGLGIGSHVSWTVAGGIEYHVTGPLSLSGMYRYKQVRYDNGRIGRNHFKWNDAVAQGWFIGVSIALPAR